MPPKILGKEVREDYILSLLKLYVQQQWDPGTLCDDIEDETAIAVQRDLYSLEHHIR